MIKSSNKTYTVSERLLKCFYLLFYCLQWEKLFFVVVVDDAFIETEKTISMVVWHIGNTRAHKTYRNGKMGRFEMEAKTASAIKNNRNKYIKAIIIQASVVFDNNNFVLCCLAMTNLCGHFMVGQRRSELLPHYFNGFGCSLPLPLYSVSLYYFGFA